MARIALSLDREPLEDGNSGSNYSSDSLPFQYQEDPAVYYRVMRRGSGCAVMRVLVRVARGCVSVASSRAVRGRHLTHALP